MQHFTLEGKEQLKPLKIGSIIVISILYPTFLLTLLVSQGKNDAFASTISTLFMIGLLFFVPWVIISLYLRTIWLLLLLAALLYIQSWWNIGIVVTGCLLIYLLLSRHMTKESVSIISPSSHRLCVFQGGNTFLINHHWNYLAQRYALDLAGLDATGRRARGFFPGELTAYHCFGTPLLSPLMGTVVHVENDHPDLAVGSMDKDHPFGNCIIIQPTSQPNVRVIFAHLMSHSVTAQLDSIVQPGEMIGRIGNSGNTSEPHLHIHAQKVENGKVKGVPLKVDGRQLMRNMVLRPSPIPLSTAITK